MMQCPFLSIILPIYNVEDYLRLCIDTLLGETFQDYEIILVDDGATDGCPQICDEYAGRYGKIRVVHKENGGLASARNAGLLKARGEYVFFLDSDDYIETGALGVIAEALKEKTIDILKYNYILQPSGQTALSVLEPGLYGKKEMYGHVIPLALDFYNEFVLSACTHIYRRKFLLENGLKFISERKIGSEDYLFNLQAFLKADRFLAIPDGLYNYVYREGSLTKRYRPNLIPQYLALYLAIGETFRKNQCETMFRQKLDCFYVWNCFHVLAANEAVLTDSHEKKEALANIRELLRQKELREALCRISLRNETKKHCVAWLLMKTRCTNGIWMWMKISQKKHRR